MSQLSLVNDYFDQPNSVLYEDDLVKHFGRDTITQAIRKGIIQHRWVPCGKNRRRCVCWLNTAS